MEKRDQVATFFDSKMVCESGGYSPSGTKPRFVMDDWIGLDLVDVQPFAPVGREQILLAHSSRYVDGVFAGRIANGHGNRSLQVAESTRWTVGSMVAAARAAIDTRVACSPSSGFHHAHYESGGGFCTFNGLVIAARLLIEDSTVQRVGILDCDWHFGDGTEDILEVLQLRSRIFHRTSGEEVFEGASDYLAWLQRSLDELWNEDVDLILYQAGADAHRADPLGGLLSDEEMAERDRTVFDYCRSKSISVAWNLAGGYQRAKNGSIKRVIELHRNTMMACLEVFENRSI